MSERVEIRYEINAEEFSEQSRQIEGAVSKSSASITDHVDKVEKSVKRSATSYIEAGDDLKSIIEIQKSAIKDLERQYKQASTQIGRLPSGRAKEALKGELSSIEREIRAEKDALNELAGAKKNVDAASVSLRTQLANVRDEMGKLGLEGKHESARYRELETEMGRLGIQYRRLQEHQKLLSRGSSSLAGFVSGMQALSGAAAVATGAVGLFVDKNEDMARIQTKIQGVMAISMGMMQITNVLHETSAFRLTIGTRITNLWALANTRASGTLIKLGFSATAANLAAKALMATLTLGLSVAIGAIIYGITKWRQSQQEIIEQQKTMRDALVDSMMEIHAERKAVDELFDTLKKTTKGTDEYNAAKSRILDQYGKYLSGMSAEIESLSDIEGAYRAITSAAMESVTARQKSSFIDTAVEAESEKMGEAIKTMGDNLTKYFSGFGDNFQDQVEATLAEVIQELTKADKTPEQISRSVMDALLDRGVNFEEIRNNEPLVKTYLAASDKASAIYDIANKIFVTEKATNGEVQSRLKNQERLSQLAQSILLAEKELIRLRAPGTTSDKDAIEGTERRLKEYRAEMELLTGSSGKSGTSKSATLDAESKLYEDRIKQSRDYQNRLVELAFETEQARVDAMAEGIAKSAVQIDLDYRKQLTAIELWSREIQDKIVAEQKSAFLASGGKESSFIFNPDDLDTLEDMAALNEGVRARMTASDREYETSHKKLLDSLKTQWSGWADEYEKIELEITQVKKKANEDRAALAAAYESGNISDATLQAGTEVVDSGEKAELSRLNSAKIKLSKEWVQVFKDIEILSRKEIKELINNINEQLESSELSPADASALYKQLERLKDWDISHNPFAAFYDGLKEVEKATKDVEAAQKKLQQATGTTNEEEARKALAEAETKQRIAEHKVLKAAQESVRETAAMANALVGLLSTLGMESQTLNAALGALDHLASMDLTKPFSIVTGAIGALSSILGGIFGKSDRRRERDIRRIQEQVDKLRKAYQNLNREIDKSFSTSKANKTREQQDNLIQQRKLIQEQIDRENGKKKKNKGRIGQWESELEEIDEQLKDLEEAARDAIFGADLNSAINDFATAYMEAWSAGEDRAIAQKNVVKEMIRGIISEMMKSDIAAAVEQMRERIERMMSDDHLSEEELEEIARMGDNIGAIMDKRSEMYEKWMQTMGLDNDKSITGAIRGTIATEQSVSELGGIFRGQWDSLKQIEMSVSGSVAQVSSIARTNLLIEFNTRQTAGNTAIMTNQLDKMSTTLTQIDKNTKPESYAR